MSKMNTLLGVKGDAFTMESYSNTNCGTPCFKSKELAEQAIKILGEETIKLALLQV